MAIIQLTGRPAENYRLWLQAYRDKTGQEPKAAERTEAFMCARSGDDWSRPHWIR